MTATAIGAAVVREPLTYDPQSSVSYFRDLVLARLRSDGAAKERLERHAVEMRRGASA